MPKKRAITSGLTFRDIGILLSIRDDQDNRLDEGCPVSSYGVGHLGDTSDGGHVFIIDACVSALQEAVNDAPTAVFAEASLSDYLTFTWPVSDGKLGDRLID